MPTYTVTEPHPSVPQNSWTHSGRGGAGNAFRAPMTTSPSGVPTQPNTSTPSAARFYSGRGGAGNAHAASERPVMSFDEEFTRAEVREQASTMGHVGRGGAGNVFASEEKKYRKQSTSSSRRDSSSTNGSERASFWGRLSNASLGHR